MRRSIFILVCITLLAGCSTSQMLRPEKPPVLEADSDKALLVIVRDAWIGSAIVFWNYLDGKFIGETQGKTYFVTQVSPGNHYVVGATENTAVAQFDFQPGKKYFLRQGVTMGLWRARTSGYYPMAAAEAQKVMQSLTYLQLDATKSFPDMDPALYKKAIDEYRTGVKENPEGYKELLEYKGE